MALQDDPEIWRTIGGGGLAGLPSGLQRLTDRIRGIRRDTTEEERLRKERMDKLLAQDQQRKQAEDALARAERADESGRVFTAGQNALSQMAETKKQAGTNAFNAEQNELDRKNQRRVAAIAAASRQDAPKTPLQRRSDLIESLGRTLPGTKYLDANGQGRIYTMDDVTRIADQMVAAEFNIQPEAAPPAPAPAPAPVAAPQAAPPAPPKYPGVGSTVGRMLAPLMPLIGRNPTTGMVGVSLRGNEVPQTPAPSAAPSQPQVPLPNPSELPPEVTALPPAVRAKWAAQYRAAVGQGREPIQAMQIANQAVGLR